MTTTDWIINIVLIAIVALQIWERRLSVVQLLLPFAIVCWAAFVFVHSVPTQGNSPVAIGFIVLVGTVLGAAIGLLTRVRLRDGKVVARAGLWAAGLWSWAWRRASSSSSGRRAVAPRPSCASTSTTG